jgi:carbonic anhydrase/acetyltransferase-like protein (isoleucine patch superfamily)
VIRGDKNQVKIGQLTNIQDRAVISTAGELESGFPASVHIGDSVTIGHGALLTSCVVKDNTLIGQGAIISAGAEIGSNTIIAAGAVVLPDTLVPDNQLWAGNPAKFIRNVTEEEIANLEKSAEFYSQLSKDHQDEHVDDSDLHNAK